MDNDFLFGLKFDFDPSDFLRGSAEAQDQLERTVAAIIHARQQSQEEVDALAKALSRSPQEVKAALAELAKVERDADRDRERASVIAERREAERHRNEMAALRERTQAVTNLRDAMLSVAAITLGGAGVAGVTRLLTDTSERGVSEAMFAQRTGTDMRQNLAEEEGAYLSGMSNREEARASIAAYANAQSERRTRGISSLEEYFTKNHVAIDPSFYTMGHERAIQYLVNRMRGMGWNQHDIAYHLDASGITSGGYTNLAMNPEELHRWNQQGMERAGHLADSAGDDLKFQRTWRNLVSDVDTFRADLGHTIEPWVDGMDVWVRKFDRLAKEHPDLARDVIATTAVVTALGGLFAAILPIVGTALAIRTAFSAASAAKAAANAVEGGAEGAASEAAAIASGGIMRFVPLLGAAYLALHPTNTSSNDTLTPQQRANMRFATDNNDEFRVFSDSVASIEHADYGQMGGSGGAYAGRYQMSRAAISDAAHTLGVSVPTQQQFLSDPAMQERFFRAYTRSNESYLGMHSGRFRAMSPEERLAVLSYAHNQGAGGALHWLDTGVAAKDGFGTSGSRYSDLTWTNLHRMVPPPGASSGGSSVVHNSAPVNINGPITVNANNFDDFMNSLRNRAKGVQDIAYNANSAVH